MNPRFSSALILAAVSCHACALFEPDYQPDPDETLVEILKPVKGDQSDGLKAPAARQRLDRLVAQYPSHAPSLLAAGAMALDAGDNRVAQGYLDRVLELRPQDAEARMLRARVAVGDGNVRLAQRILDEGVTYRPDEPRLHESLAWVHSLQRNHDVAMQSLAQAAKLGAPAWRVHFNRGLVEERRGNIDAAIRHFERCLAERSDYLPAKQRCDGLRAQGR